MTKAIQLFDNRNFAEAESLLENILKEKPDDFMANYFYGACRTENNHFTNADLEALIKANQEVSPIDINYYFGVQYHARENWERALKFYNKYKSTASLTEDEKQKIFEKIQQCYDKVNPYEAYIVEENKKEIIPLVNPITSSGTIARSDLDSTLEDQEEVIIAPVALAQESEDLEVEEIEFQINSEFYYLYLSHFKTEDGKNFYNEGDAKQKELENLSIQLDELRDEYNDAKTTDSKKLIGQDILSLENETYSLKKEVAQLFFQAKKTEGEYWENAEYEDIEAFKKELIRIEKSKEKDTNKKTEISLDSTVYINPNILLNHNDIAPQVEESVEIDLIYKIQIGAYSRGLPNYIKKLFDKLSLIRQIENYTDVNGVVVYTTGNLTNYDDALKMRNQVRQEGVEDAIVVPYFKGKRITLDEAKELEGAK